MVSFGRRARCEGLDVVRHFPKCDACEFSQAREVWAIPEHFGGGARQQSVRAYSNRDHTPQGKEWKRFNDVLGASNVSNGASKNGQ